MDSLGSAAIYCRGQDGCLSMSARSLTTTSARVAQGVGLMGSVNANDAAEAAGPTGGDADPRVSENGRRVP
ncbi:hypothetical protein [Microbispora rosea]|uniref:hypothetical protein n=1 Tax=Microbispora rosea TaxID=58117 RepID=UPI003D8BDDA7